MKKLGAWFAALLLMVGTTVWFGCTPAEEPAAEEAPAEAATEAPAEPAAE
ncbi:MAG: hypothetical protein QM518_02755 [Verrucomicrobiota bacterium]|jgi:hypothetical protein|nr:hypothetical protein [Verrucomicrobiota bacterium]